MDITRIDIDSCAPSIRPDYVIFYKRWYSPYGDDDHLELGVKAETLYDWRRAERLYARLDSSARAASESMWTKIRNYANLAKAQGLEEVWGTSATNDGYAMVIQVSSRSGPEPIWTRRHVDDILTQATRLNRESSKPRSLVLTLEQSLELDADDDRCHELAMRSRHAASMFCEAIKMRLDQIVTKDGDASSRSSHTFLIVNEGRQHMLKYSNFVWDLCFDRIYACTADAPIFRPFERSQ